MDGIYARGVVLITIGIILLRPCWNYVLVGMTVPMTTTHGDPQIKLGYPSPRLFPSTSGLD